ncbi:MAG: hypothetical protein WCA30_00730 [Dermatophilaceae bacterium]
MSTLAATSSRVDVLHPMPAATAGAVTFTLAMTAGEVFGLNADAGTGPATSPAEISAYAALVLAAMLVALWLGLRARAGSPKRLAAPALALAIAAALLLVAFWSGWSQTLGAVAMALALEHRRRNGSFSATTAAALIIGAIAFLASTTTCVLG